MNIKKLISSLLFTLIGFSLANASENAISLIKNSEIENTRKLGYELCRLYLKDDRTYFESIKESIWGTTPEKAVARELLKDHELIGSIFSRKASEDSTIYELQEGCFDFLAKEIRSHVKSAKKELNFSNPEIEDAYGCASPKEVDSLRFHLYWLELCNETQLELRKTLQEQTGFLKEKVNNATEFPFQLIKSLGRPGRLKKLERKLKNLLEELEDLREDL